MLPSETANSAASSAFLAASFVDWCLSQRRAAVPVPDPPGPLVPSAPAVALASPNAFLTESEELSPPGPCRKVKPAWSLVEEDDPPLCAPNMIRSSGLAALTDTSSSSEYLTDASVRWEQNWSESYQGSALSDRAESAIVHPSLEAESSVDLDTSAESLGPGGELQDTLQISEVDDGDRDEAGASTIWSNMKYLSDDDLNVDEGFEEEKPVLSQLTTQMSFPDMTNFSDEDEDNTAISENLTSSVSSNLDLLSRIDNPRSTETEAPLPSDTDFFLRYLESFEKKSREILEEKSS